MSFMNIIRKISLVSTCLMFSVASIFAVARPSVDGHAVVADAGAMPKGLFAKTVGYLPGDSVSVTNPSSGITISVLVLGSIDPSEGVAILLSPEAADRLKIKKGANIQVKITKREGDVDEVVSGSAVISDDSIKTETKKDTSAELATTSAPVVSETPLVSSVKDDSGDIVSEVTENSSDSSEAVDDSIDYLAKDVVTDEPEVAVIDDTPIVTSKVSNEERVDDVLPSESDYYSLPAIVSENNIEEKREDYSDYNEVQDKNAAPVEVVDESAPALEKRKTATAKSETVDGNAPALEKSKTVLPKSEVVDGTAPALDNRKKSAKTEAVTDELPPVESGAIVLVPAAVNPPDEDDKSKAEATKKAEEERKAIAQAYLERKAAEEAAAAELEAEKAKAKELASVPEPKKEEKAKTSAKDTKKGVDKTGFDSYIVPDVNKLKAGNYVQIASLSDTDNIKGIVKSYGSKYPIEIVPSSVKKNSYQILIGPLSVDEYGTVLERFKSRGYRDAYLRKIK